MKKGIHPKYEDCTIVCVCGNTVHTRATKPNIHVEICSKCHPFYTGKQKLVDSAGMVEKFQKRYAKKGAAPKAEPKAAQEEMKEAPKPLQEAPKEEPKADTEESKETASPEGDAA